MKLCLFYDVKIIETTTIQGYSSEYNKNERNIKKLVLQKMSSHFYRLACAILNGTFNSDVESDSYKFDKNEQISQYGVFYMKIV